MMSLSDVSPIMQVLEIFIELHTHTLAYPKIPFLGEPWLVAQLARNTRLSSSETTGSVSAVQWFTRSEISSLCIPFSIPRTVFLKIPRKKKATNSLL